MIDLYTKAVGHPPEWRDDPDWLYKGTEEELEELEARLGIKDEGDPIDGQMELL